jgi:predicted ATPase/DNA-binding NarL/FixJ family response regulator
MNAEEWARIRRLHESGISIKGIARRLGLSRNTVRKAVAAASPPRDRRRARASAVDAYESAILEILAAEPAASAPEIAERIGWSKSMTVLRDRLRVLRAGAVPARAGRAGPVRALPAEVTSFVGRRRELAEIRELLGIARLVTLTGSGGIGKTRLAVRAAEQLRRAFPDGARLVELAALRDTTLVAQTIVDQLGVAAPTDAVRSAEEALHEHLASRHMLIVLDNCEHLLGACALLVGRLLRAAPELHMLATSRQALGVDGEHLVIVPPLAVSERAVEDGPAVELFAARAAAVKPGFEVDHGNAALVREICRQLDGVPLAIELAAIQLRVFSVEELTDRLAQRLPVLAAPHRGGPERHRSLQTAMDWSYERCSELERQVWARASVFAGGFDLEACEAVCGQAPGRNATLGSASILDAVAGLVDKSIVLREEQDGHVRFRMLEPIREAGQSHLSARERERYRRRHLAWCGELIGRVVRGWFGREQGALYRRMRVEHANLRAAMECALEIRDGTWAALVGEPWFLWVALSLSEHRYWLGRGLAGDTRESRARGWALTTYAFVATLQGDRDAARAPLVEAARIARAAGDGLAFAYVEHVLGLGEFFAGEIETARERLVETLAAYADAGAPADLVGALCVHLGLIGIFDDDIGWAEEQFTRIADRCEQHGERWLLAYATVGLGIGELSRGDADRAAERALRSLGVLSTFQDAIGLALTLDLLAWAEAARGRGERAAVLLGAASDRWRSFGAQLYGSSHWIAQREHFERRAREAVGDDAFAAAFARGAAMSLEMVLEDVLGTSGDRGAVGSSGDEGRAVELTPREEEVVALIAGGLTNREIAGRLVVSRRTVEGHVGNALRKLGFERRSQLAAWAASRAGSRYPVGRVKVGR